MRTTQQVLGLLVVFAFLGGCAAEPENGKQSSPIVNPAVSSDGNTIAFGQSGRVWTIPLEGGIAVRASVGNGWERKPRFDPTGNYLGMLVDRGQGDELHLIHRITPERYSVVPGRFWDFRPTGGNEKLSKGGAVIDFDFGPSDSEIAISWPQSYSTADYYTRDLISEGKIGLWTFDLSSDGRYAATNWPWPTTDIPDFSNHSSQRGEYVTNRVSYMELPHAEYRNIVANAKHEYSEPRFSPDAEYIFFVESDTFEQRLVRFSLTSKSTDHYRLPVSDVLGIEVHPNGHDVILAGSNGLHIFDIRSQRTRKIPILAYQNRRIDTSSSSSSAIILNVQIVDVVNGGIIDAPFMSVNDGRISEIGNSGFDFDTSQPIIDAEGRYMMPGLVDVHWHIYHPDQVIRLPELLKSGITTLVSPASGFPKSLEVADAIERGDIQGPTLFLFSPKVDGVRPRDEEHDEADTEAAIRMARKYADAGFVGIKLYSSLSPEASIAVLKEVDAVGLKSIMHAGATDWETAVDHGVDVITHANTYFAACERFPGRGNFLPRPFVSPDKKCLQRVFAKMREQGTFFDPTIVATRSWPLGIAALERAYFEASASVVLLAHSENVKMIAGTDNTAWWLFDELETYAEIGLPNETILQMATINPAQFVGKGESSGTIDIGKNADLLLLDRNPLEDLTTLRKPALIMKDGKIVLQRF